MICQRWRPPHNRPPHRPWLTNESLEEQQGQLHHYTGLDRLRPFGVSTDSVSFDVRVGGHYTYTMTNAQTAETFPTGGVFLEVDPIDRLVFTWGEPGAPIETAPVITLTFIEQGDRTELVFHLRGFDGKPGDGFVYDGWDEALTNLDRHLAGEPLG